MAEVCKLTWDIVGHGTTPSTRLQGPPVLLSSFISLTIAAVVPRHKQPDRYLGNQ